MKPTLSVRPVPVLIFHVYIFYITCLCTFLIARTGGICCVGTWGLLDLQQLLRKGHSQLAVPPAAAPGCSGGPWQTATGCMCQQMELKDPNYYRESKIGAWRCRSNIFLFHVLLIFALCYTSPVREGTCMLKVAQVGHFTRSKRSACVKF